jgi:hypothetical protein
VIKEKKNHSFRDADADSLVLWKVSIPVDRSLKQNIGNHSFADEDLLSPVDELSEVFSEGLSQKHLHIVIKAPPVGQSEDLIEC